MPNEPSGPKIYPNNSQKQWLEDFYNYWNKPKTMTIQQCLETAVATGLTGFQVENYFINRGLDSGFDCNENRQISLIHPYQNIEDFEEKWEEKKKLKRVNEELLTSVGELHADMWAQKELTRRLQDELEVLRRKPMGNLGEELAAFKKEFQAENEQLKSEVLELRKEKESFKTSLHFLFAENEIRMTSVGELSQKVQELQKENESFKTSLDKCHVENKELEMKVQQLQDCAKDSKELIRRLEQALNSLGANLQLDIENNEFKFHELQECLNGLKLELQTLQNESKKSQQLQDQIAVLANKNDSDHLKLEIRELRIDMKTQQAALQDDIRDLRKDLENREKHHVEPSGTLLGVMMEAMEMKKEHKDTVAEMEKKHQSEIESLQKQVILAVKEADQVKAARDRLQDDLAEKQHEYLVLSKELNKMCDTAERLNMEYQKLKGTLEESERMKVGTSQQLARQYSEILNLKEELARTKEKLAEKKALLKRQLPPITE